MGIWGDTGFIVTVDQLTPLPLGEVRICRRITEVSAEHGFCTRMKVIGEDQRWDKQSHAGKGLK